MSTDKQIDADDRSFGRDYAKVGDLEVEADDDRVRVSGTWGEAVFGLWGETVEEAFQRLAEFTECQDDPRPDPDNDVYRCEGDAPFERCNHCDHLPNADHHTIFGEEIVACRWDDINDFEIFDERGRVVECPECGGNVRDEPSKHVEGTANVTCRDCGEEFFRESYDFGDYPAGQQELKNTEFEVVARVF